MMQQVATGPTYLEIVARNSDQTSYVIPFWLFPFILVPELLFASSSIAASVALSPRVTLRQRQRSSFGRLVGQSVGRFGQSVGQNMTNIYRFLRPQGAADGPCFEGNRWCGLNTPQTTAWFYILSLRLSVRHSCRVEGHDLVDGRWNWNELNWMWSEAASPTAADKMDIYILFGMFEGCQSARRARSEKRIWDIGSYTYYRNPYTL